MSDHLITTPPGLTVCTKCHTPVLAATIGGLDRHVDPAALTPEGQLRAAERGLALFLLRGDRLYRLTAEHVMASGAAMTVMPEHTCRPVPDRFIDGVHMEAAIFLVTNLLGATAVDTEATPPY